MKLSISSSIINQNTSIFKESQNESEKSDLKNVVSLEAPASQLALPEISKRLSAQKSLFNPSSISADKKEPSAIEILEFDLATKKSSASNIIIPLDKSIKGNALKDNISTKNVSGTSQISEPRRSTRNQIKSTQSPSLKREHTKGVSHHELASLGVVPDVEGRRSTRNLIQNSEIEKPLRSLRGGVAVPKLDVNRKTTTSTQSKLSEKGKRQESIKSSSKPANVKSFEKLPSQLIAPVQKKHKVKDDTRYCICNDVAYGKMIACDDKNCPIEWYHLSCSGLSRPPKGQWFCKSCTIRRAKRRR